jgi:hypothetical protein
VAHLFYCEFDIAGSSGDEVSRTVSRIMYMHEWENGFYVMPQLTLVNDYEHRTRNILISPEMGVNVNTVTVFTTPAMGIGPDRGEVEWGILLGIRMNY